MELVEARGATQQLPSGRDSPNPENNWSQASTVTRGRNPNLDLTCQLASYAL